MAAAYSMASQSVQPQNVDLLLTDKNEGREMIHKNAQIFHTNCRETAVYKLCT